MEARRWRILVSRCTATGWSPPESPAFAGDGVEADPWFTPDGKSLYFLSTRTVAGIERKNLDIWRVDRNDAGTWGTPTRLPEPVNSPAEEWFPRPSVDGWLYFGSGRPGGLGGTDIWRARADAAGAWTVENLGAAVNTAGEEYEPLPSPDGGRLIVMADGDRSTRDGWRSGLCSRPADARSFSRATPVPRTPESFSYGTNTAPKSGLASVPIHFAASHHELYSAKGGDVAARITLGRNQVGLEARRDGADLVPEPKRGGRE